MFNLALNRHRNTGPHDRLVLADSVEKVGFSARLNSGATTTGEPTHHIEWFLGPSLTFAALLMG
jgi:hypothetical protein